PSSASGRPELVEGRIADCGLRISELRFSGFADDESAVSDPRSAVSCEAVKLGSRNFSIALSPQSAAGTPRKPATIAPIASAISGYVIADGDSCGPCQGPWPWTSLNPGAPAPRCVVAAVSCGSAGPCATS